MLIQDIGNSTFSNIDPGVDLTLSMLVTQFRDGGDGVEAGVLGQGIRNDLESLGEALETVGIGTD